LVISEGHGDGWLRRRGFWLEYASIAWMIVEAATAITAGIIASSIALTGFGLDSVIELAAAVIVVWQHRGAEGHPNIAAVEAPRLCCGGY
jgi:divalent metal cation (Fe/Co/Zn/Cd) transporter